MELGPGALQDVLVVVRLREVEAAGVVGNLFGSSLNCPTSEYPLSSVDQVFRASPNIP